MEVSSALEGWGAHLRPLAGQQVGDQIQRLFSRRFGGTGHGAAFPLLGTVGSSSRVLGPRG